MFTAADVWTRPYIDRPDWYDQANCKGMTHLFYPEGREGGGATLQSQDAVRRAKALCAACPVRNDCLHHAQTHREHHGIWGGLAPKQRQQLRRGRVA